MAVIERDTTDKAAHKLGFTTLDKEVAIDALPVQGTLPGWLAGTLIRNGPGQFEAGDRRLNHWFDGFAQLHAFTFRGGRVAYKTQFLKTRGFEAARQTGELHYSEFGTDPCRTTFQKIFTMLKPPSVDDFSLNANVNLSQIAGQMVALTEVTVPVAFDPETLDTLGVVGYEDAIDDMVTTAHPHYDYRRKQAVNYVSHLGVRPHYKVYGLADGSKTRRVLGTHPADQLAYMHSFGMTENYAVLVESPFVVSMWELLAKQPFLNSLKWRPERGTTFTLIHLDTGEVTQVQGEPLATFHHVNAYEQGGEVIVDVVAYDDSEIYTVGLRLDTLLDEDGVVPGGQLRRYRLKPGTGEEATREDLSEHSLELPRINYKWANTQPYRYAYGISNSGTAKFTDQLSKVDVETRETTLWREPGTFPGEPVFVSAPGATAEDEGVVLSIVLDGDSGTSFMVVLDAQTFTEIARAEVPHHIPHGFHGVYLRD